MRSALGLPAGHEKKEVEGRACRDTRTKKTITKHNKQRAKFFLFSRFFPSFSCNAEPTLRSVPSITGGAPRRFSRSLRDGRDGGFFNQANRVWGEGGWDTNWIARSNPIINESTAKFKKSKPKLNPSFTRTQVGYAAHRIWARCIISSSQSYSCKYYEHGDCSWITLQQLILLSYCSFFCKGEHGALHANSNTHGLRGGCWWGGRTI